MPAARKTLRAGIALLTAAVGLGLTSVPATAAPQDLPDGPKLARQLVKKVGITAMNRHLIALQRFADRTGGTRASGTEGHVQSAEYIATKLEDAGFVVTRQEFPIIYDQTDAETLTVGGTDVPIERMTYSSSTPEGGATGPLVVVPVDATPGCEATDYDGLSPQGAIVLVSRGGCPFAQKAEVAGQVGAAGAVVYNNVPGALAGGFAAPVEGSAPTGGITQADGAALAEQEGVEVTLDIRGLSEPRTTYNVIAETQTGRHDNVVMAGAHLDSVTDGPGINDNGSGSVALLETALQLGSSPKVNNAVRFAWWGAEEIGLVGSTHYVDDLSLEEQLDIALYLNFDMIGSPNAGYFVFDGDDSDGVGAGPGPYGSAQIEAAFQEFYAAAAVPTEGKDFDGRSDYGPFIATGIPAGGLFTGAEQVKTEAQAAKWGGVAGTAFDSCYHQSCDTLGNVDRAALDRNADAEAFVLASYAISTEDVNGVPSRAERAKVRAAAQRTTSVPVAHDHES